MFHCSNLSLSLSISVCLSVCLSVCVCVCVCLCLSVCLSLPLSLSANNYVPQESNKLNVPTEINTIINFYNINKTRVYTTTSLNQILLIFLLHVRGSSKSQPSLPISPQGLSSYLIYHDSATHIHGLAVRWKQGVPFAHCSSC